MRNALTSLLLLLLMLFALLAVLLIDTDARVQVSSSEQVDKADSVIALFEQMRTVIRERQYSHQVSISPAQAHSLAGFLQRARGDTQADVTFSKDSASLKISYFLGTVVTDFYLNAEVKVLSAPGVQIESVQIGNLTLPGNWALAVLEYLVNQRTQSGLASRALEWVTKVDISEAHILLDLAPSEPVLQALKEVKRQPDDLQTKLLKDQIVHYLRFLENVSLVAQLQNKVSLVYYLSAVMQEASRLSESSDATLQNEAAIMALAIYAGNYRFSRLVGSLSIPVQDIPTAPHPTVLAGRTDLSLHFVYSAAIKLLSEQGFSIAVGEFKELMDRGEGGSGYSFTDLAADLSGAHFAALAVDPQYAKHVQTTILQQPQEATFLPSLQGLDEGLDIKAFTDKYQAVDSPAYQQALELINDRIALLPISVR